MGRLAWLLSAVLFAGASWNQVRASSVLRGLPVARRVEPLVRPVDEEDLKEAVRYALVHPEALISLLTLSEAEGLSSVLLRQDPGEDDAGRDGRKDGKGEGREKGGSLGKTVGIDFENLSTRKLERMLWTMLIVFAVMAAIFEMIHRRWATVDLDIPISFGSEGHEQKLARIFSGVWPLCRPYFNQSKPSSRCPMYFVAALLILGLIDLGLDLIYTVWNKEFWDTIEKKHEEQFLPLMLDFCLLVFSIVLVQTYSQYVSMMLLIDWRKFMTKWLMDEWFRGKRFYQLQLEVDDEKPDNPDQRIQEDVAMFVMKVLYLVGGLISSIGTLIVKMPLLLILSPDYAFGIYYCPGWLLYASIIYSGLGTLAVHAIGKQLIVVNFAKQKYEADFRYNIVQVRDNAESIALYNAEECERKRLEASFAWIVRVWWKLMLYHKRLGFFTYFYFVTSYTFPWILLAPNYFKGQISLGMLFMLFGALFSVKGAFDWIIGSYSSIADFRATVDRLHNFNEAMGNLTQTDPSIEWLNEPPEDKTGGNKLAVLASGMCVGLPQKGGGRILWKEAELEVHGGSFVLLSAPSGSGKSCFFRALAGIWPHASGRVYLPSGTLFIPQQSFIPQGTLKQAVAYPESEGKFSDEEVRAALDVVRLEAVKGRALAEEANWQMELSGGEQQRLAIAHAVLRRPSVLFLDEATSAVGNEGALELFATLRRKGTLPEGAAVVSISHDVKLLAQVHDVHYEYDKDGKTWTLAERRQGMPPSEAA